MPDLLTNLNEAQKKAVTHNQGPLLIVAGAGTGKTTVITSKIAWLIMEQGVKPEDILALTFTEKAAAEMEERVDRLLPLGYADLWISTFHSFAERILKEHALEIGLPQNYKLLNTTAQWLLIKKNLDRFNLDYYRPLGNPTKFIHALLKLFSRAKDENISAAEYLEYAEGLKLNADSADFVSDTLDEAARKKLTKQQLKELAAEEIKKQQEIANAFHVYQQLLLENDALDFGDLINYVLKLFQSRKSVLAKYQSQFKHILVDEFQDTNYAQYELIRLLAGADSNLTVVGDDDQCLPGDSKILTETGSKRIDQIKKGDKILSAVGRGSVCYYPVSNVFKNKKTALLRTLITSSGKKITVTDNHKMFCLTLAVSDKRYFYVYLMQRVGLGWCLGVTNDLAGRLRLERSADRIIGIKTCASDAEARFFETLYSLKYKIPTVCFKARDGVVIKGHWLDKLYHEIDTEKSVRCLADDLNLDLSAHHYSLAAVNRGQKLRIKINLELCHRKYRSKNKGVMTRPQISHLLSLETSDPKIINKLSAAGFTLKRTKSGARLRLLSADLAKLGLEADKLAQLTGGIFEAYVNLGSISSQSRKSLVMPAKNVLVGNYLPIIKNGRVVLEQVVRITESKPAVRTVYDLEVVGPHNFCADGVIVHNSIYKFRGASISNILQFKEDYPKAAEIYLTNNYRSSQNILDLSYRFIQRNNPDRLEVRLKSANQLSKKLISRSGQPGEIRHLHGRTINDEVELTVNTIIERYNASPENSWSDFAILVRANAAADDFCRALDLAKVPYVFLASRGLYQKPIILNILNWFRVLDDYHENAAFFRVLNFPGWRLDEKDIINLNYWSYRKGWSLFETAKQNALFSNLSDAAREQLKTILTLLETQTKAAQAGLKPTQLLTEFLNKSGYLSRLVATDSLANRDELNCLNQFYRKIGEFEKETAQPDLPNLMDLLALELEAGESGALAANPEDSGPDTVKIMTVHGSKGLEFKYVFIANLVDKKFPSIGKTDPIELPAALVKEAIPEGDIHLAEERRLFYVAMTRAKEGLYFSSAEDYGGARLKKLSRFLAELAEDGFQLAETSLAQPQPFLKISPTTDNIKAKAGLAEGQRQKLPDRFSFTQLKAYENCPYQYRFAHILRIPLAGKPQFSFGKSMHSTMQKFFLLVNSRQGLKQADLFDQTEKPPEITWEDIKNIYDQSFIDDWYPDRKTKDNYYQRGLVSLKKFLVDWQQTKAPAEQVEYGFTFKLNRDCILRGAIDRIDKIADGLKLVDYKTGSPKEKLAPEDKEQLLIYQMAAQEILKTKVAQLSFYYFDNNTEVSFLGQDKEIEKLKENILATVAEIRTGCFEAKPEKEKCRWCDFKSICDFAA
ncbi:MAG: UvrD-helicase domain-containing protein [Patescibacteria group bacterium]